MIMAFYSLSGSLATEVEACTIIHAVMLVPDLIRFNLVQFQKELSASGCGWKSFAHLRNTFVQLQDYDRFEILFHKNSFLSSTKLLWNNNIFQVFV